MSIKDRFSSSNEERTHIAPMSVDEKTRYLVSNPHVIATYGSDAAANFVSTLRDEQLDPDLRRHRIIEQRATLQAFIDDLDAVIKVSDDPKITSDATFNRDNLASLISMSDMLASISIQNEVTDALEEVTNVATAPNQHLGLTFEQHDTLSNPRTDTHEHFVIITHDQAKGARKQRNATWMAIIFAVMFMVMMFTTPESVLMAALSGALVVSISYAFIASDVAQEKETIPKDKFNAFLKNCTGYRYQNVKELLGLDMKYTASSEKTIVSDNMSVRDWFITSKPIFDAIDISTINKYTRNWAKTQEATPELRALDKLRDTFTVAMTKDNKYYIEQQREKAEKERKAALEKIESSRRIQNMIEKKNIVLTEYVEGTNTTPKEKA